MNLFSSDPVKVLTCLISIQFVILVMAVLAAVAVWLECRRTNNAYLSFIFLSVLAIVLNYVFMLGMLAWSASSPDGLVIRLMPLVEHFFKVSGTILFVYAFVVANPHLQFTKRYFLISNILIMVLATSAVMIHWLQYLDAAPPGTGKFPLFWGDLACEVWITFLLGCGMFFVRRADVAVKGGFILAFAILISRELLHIGNIVVSHNEIFWARAVEGALLIFFCGIIILATCRSKSRRIGAVEQLRQVLRGSDDSKAGGG